MRIILFGKPELLADQRNLKRLIDECEATLGPVERVSATSRSGVSLMQVYDIVTTPAWVVLQDDGVALGIWQHTPPSLNDLGAHFRI